MFYLILIIFKLLGWILSFFPRPLFLLLGRGLGALLFLVGFRTNIAQKNIELAFPDWSAEKKADLLHAHFTHLGILFLEIFRSFYRFDDFVRRYSDVEGEEHLRAALAKGKGIFVLTAHLGNWEVLTASGPTLFSTGVTMVTKELKPKGLHRAVKVTRELLGVKMACEPRTMPGILRELKNKGIVGFVMDQFTGAPYGARVPFFGLPVGSHTALATLALRTEAPIVPALSFRQANGRYLIRFEPELSLIRDENLEKATILNTAFYVKHTEAWVRERPEQWMWIHRRWKGDLSPLPPHSVGEMLK